MKLAYSNRAFADLDRILAWYSANASPAVAEDIERRLDDVVDRICGAPESAPPVPALAGSRRRRHSLSVPDFLSSAPGQDRHFTYSAHVKTADRKAITDADFRHGRLCGAA